MTPDQYTIEETMLAVGDGHQLYVQVWGNNDAAETFIWLHGGPGSGSKDKHKTIFDPLRHRVIFFDQRGCGKSLPYGSREHNDTDAQVQDINALADHFNAPTFTLVGGSWGSCLALVYAIRYPQRVNRLVLRGIFTGRKSEVDFVDQGGCRDFFPDAWQAFVDSVPSRFKDRPAAYHLPRLLGDDPKAAKQAAYAYSNLEGSLVSLDDRPSSEDYETFDPNGTILEYHYISNGCFIPEGYIMDNAAALTMPIDIVQGRYDAVCPPVTAYELHQKLPNSRLFWAQAGHAFGDRANWEVTKGLL